jgi:hypothetical protein
VLTFPSTVRIYVAAEPVGLIEQPLFCKFSQA